MNNFDPPIGSPLGKNVPQPAAYDSLLLFPIARRIKREELGIAGTLPFFGVDIWNAYELSWLNLRGKPQIALATIMAPADSPNIVESKSLKLYLNSLSHSRLAGPEAVLELMRADLSQSFGAPVQIKLTLPDAFSGLTIAELEGMPLDRLDIELEGYDAGPEILKADNEQPPVEETLVSQLLKSNCPVTGQPDWASVQIRYAGPQIDQERLLKYLLGFRSRDEFHEHCAERIFMDILRHCKPQKLAVYARFTRRGGIDINPWRSNFTTGQRPPNLRSARQ